MKINNYNDKGEAKKFLRELRAAMEKRGYTSTEMAIRIGCSRQKLWHFFKCSGCIDLNTAYLILQVLGLPLEIGTKF